MLLRFQFASSTRLGSTGMRTSAEKRRFMETSPPSAGDRKQPAERTSREEPGPGCPSLFSQRLLPQSGGLPKPERRAEEAPLRWRGEEPANPDPAEGALGAGRARKRRRGAEGNLT